MKKNIMKKLLLVIISAIMTGCLQKSIVDDVQLIQAVVFDLEKQKIKTTFMCPTIRSGGTGKTQVFEETASTVKQARERASLESARPFVNGQLRVALFTKRLAKKDITQVYDSLLRDNSISHTIYLGILDGDGYELFSGKYSTTFNAAIYMQRLLEHNMETGSLPNDNLHLNFRRYYREGRDTFIPILKKKKNKIRIEGLALFNESKYVGELKYNDLFVFRALLEKHRLNSHEFKIKNGYVVINNIQSIPSYQIQMDNMKPTFHITVNIGASLQEISPNIKIQNKNNMKLIKNNIEETLEAESMKLIKNFQELNVDPLGLGAKLKGQDRNYDFKSWEKIYKDVQVKVDFIVDMHNSGSIQ